MPPGSPQASQDLTSLRGFSHPAQALADQARARYLADVTGEEDVHVLVLPFQLVGNRDERACALGVVWFLKDQRWARNSSGMLKEVTALQPGEAEAAPPCPKASSSRCLVTEQQGWTFMCFLKNHLNKAKSLKEGRSRRQQCNSPREHLFVPVHLMLFLNIPLEF